jgi:hypothetical protein
VVTRGVAGVENARFDGSRGAWATSSVFPQFTGSAQTAYVAINAFIGGSDNPGFDLRSSYPDASAAQLATWKADLGSVPQPPGVPGSVWSDVKRQLTSELSNAQLVLSWYDDATAGGYLHSVVDDQFEGLSMDTSAELLRFNLQSGTALSMEEWNAFIGVFEGLGGLGVIDGPAGQFAVIASSVIGGAAAAGIGPPGIDSAIAGIDGQYIALRNQLNSDFQTALTGIGEARGAIQADYGLQSAVGGLIGSDFWQELTGDGRAQALAGAERNYDINAFRTITPGIWTAFQFPPNQIGNWCDSGEDYPAGNCEWRDGPGGVAFTLAYPNTGSCFPPVNGPCNPVQQSLANTLFGNTSASCERNWNLSACSMGVPVSDVFLGQNGWGRLPLRTCTSRNNPRAPAAISCPQTRP